MKRECIFDQNERVKKWASKQIDNIEFRDDAVAIGIEFGDQLVGAAVFDTFSPGDCMVHLASDGSKNWLTKDFIFQVFAYVFVQCKFPRCTATVFENNEPSIRIVQKFGFKEEGRLRESGRNGEDLVVFGMLRRECKYLPAGIF